MRAVLITRSRLAVLAVVAAVLVLGLPGQAGAQDAGVTIVNFSYDPESVTVNVGDTVTWTHNDPAVPHTVTSGTPGEADGVFDSGPATEALNEGDTFSVTFDSAGTFEYYCRIHPFMLAEVVVQEAATETPTAEPTATATAEPTEEPTATPTAAASPTEEPTATATAEATPTSVSEPTPEPAEPTETPTTEPTVAPASPTPQPTPEAPPVGTGTAGGGSGFPVAAVGIAALALGAGVLLAGGRLRRARQL